MSMDAIDAVLIRLNLFIVYGLAALLTLVVMAHRIRVLTVPRALPLFCWYAVVGLAVGWLLFQIFYYVTHDARDAYVSLLRAASFAPVYVCALLLLFMYPKKKPPA